MLKKMMSKVDQIIKDFEKGFEDLREEIKKDVNELVESGEITYGDAIRIFKASRMFEIQSCFPDKNHSPFIILLNSIINIIIITIIIFIIFNIIITIIFILITKIFI